MIASFGIYDSYNLLGIDLHYLGGGLISGDDRLFGNASSGMYVHLYYTLRIVIYI